MMQLFTKSSAKNTRRYPDSQSTDLKINAVRFPADNFNGVV